MGKTWRLVLAIGLAFTLAIAGTFIFGYRAGRAARQFHAENEPIRAWMSIPFIAHTHHVPVDALFQAIGVTPEGPHDRRSIHRLSRDLKRPVPELISQLQRAIAAENPSGSKPQ